MSTTEIKTTINDIRNYFSTEFNAIIEKVDEILFILEQMNQEAKEKCKR